MLARNARTSSARPSARSSCARRKTGRARRSSCICLARRPARRTRSPGTIDSTSTRSSSASAPSTARSSTGLLEHATAVASWSPRSLSARPELDAERRDGTDRLARGSIVRAPEEVRRTGARLRPATAQGLRSPSRCPASTLERRPAEPTSRRETGLPPPPGERAANCVVSARRRSRYRAARSCSSTRSAFGDSVVGSVTNERMDETEPVVTGRPQKPSPSRARQASVERRLLARSASAARPARSKRVPRTAACWSTVELARSEPSRRLASTASSDGGTRRRARRDVAGEGHQLLGEQREAVSSSRRSRWTTASVEAHSLTVHPSTSRRVSAGGEWLQLESVGPQAGRWASSSGRAADTTRTAPLPAKRCTPPDRERSEQPSGGHRARRRPGRDAAKVLNERRGRRANASSARRDIADRPAPSHRSTRPDRRARAAAGR